MVIQFGVKRLYSVMGSSIFYINYYDIYFIMRSQTMVGELYRELDSFITKANFQEVMKKLSINFGQHLNVLNINKTEEEDSTLTCETSNTQEYQVFHKAGFNMCQILGNFGKAFIVCSYNQALYLIDQHAASEKSLYVRFLKEKKLLPESHQGQPFQLQNIYKQVIIEERETLKGLSWDYQIQEEGPVFMKVRLTGVPAIFNRKCRQQEFLEIIQSYYQNRLQELSKSQKQSMATIACHNAYRIGDELTREDMRELVDTLYEMPSAYNCPHGRPIVAMLGPVENYLKKIRIQRFYELT